MSKARQKPKAESGKRRRGSAFRLALSALALLALGGCAAQERLATDGQKLEEQHFLKPQASSLTSPDASQSPRPSKEQMVRDFGKRRDQAQISAAASRLRAGDLGGCRQSLEGVLARSPEHREGLLLASELALVQGDPAAATSYAKRAAKAYPEDQDVLRALARAQGEAPATDDTSRLEAPQHAPPHSVAQSDQGRASIASGEAALAAGDGRTASAHFRGAMAVEPRNPRIAIYAAAQCLQHEQPQQALRLAQAGAAAFPEQAELQQILGIVHYRQRDFSAAAEAFRRSLSLDKSGPLAYFLMGETLEKLGDSGAADWHYQQAARLDPKYASVSPRG